ncbi:uncharacterized protein TNCT_727521 [Trichonephila clavata]|uniref:Uncharacterized protein n=1 Tax=Trichonephila clavata TaxID=2740835 RepID=A0A8X6FMN6_TRICU|nr:uncharacterized protein TNCT_727521 [Trichonephila clavata]
MDTSQEIPSSFRRDSDSSGWNCSSFPMQGKGPRIPESFNRTYLCNEHPEFCEKPEDSDLKDYCLENPAICIGDTSDLLLPKKNMSNSTMQEFHTAMFDIQLTHNISQNQSNTWGWSVFTKSNMSTILLLDPDIGLNLLCYSSNLHIDDSQEPEIFGKYFME